MTTLLLLTWHGALMVLVVTTLDRLFAARITARARRAWWLLVPLAFLLTLTLPVLPTRHPAPVRTEERIGAPSRTATPVRLDAPARALPRPPTWPPFWPSLTVAGSIIYLLIVVARTWAARRRWGCEPPCTDPALLAVLDECKATARVTTAVGLVVSGRVAAPLILGWRRPQILLPHALVASSSREQLRGVLFHELAHHRCGDIPATWLFTLVGVLHWFNPAAHFALSAWARFREEAADETAIRWLGQSSGLAYGETLLHVLRHASHLPPSAPGMALAIVEPVSQLRKRLTMIKHHEYRSTRPLLTGTVFLAVAAGILLRPVQAQNPSPSGTAAPSAPTAGSSKPAPPTGPTDDQLALRQALIDLFRKKDYKIPEEMIDDRVNTVVHEQFGDDRAAFLQRLQAQNYTEEKFREVEREKIIVQAMRYQMNAEAQEARARNILLPNVVVTDRSLADTVAWLAAKVHELYPDVQGMVPGLDPQAPQALKDAKVTLNLHNVSLLGVMRAIAQQTNGSLGINSQGPGIRARDPEPNGGQTPAEAVPQQTPLAIPADATLNQVMQSMQEEVEKTAPNQTGLQVLRGICGADGAWRDVTETLRSVARPDSLQISWDQPYSEIGGDPAFGKVKTLLVAYQLDGTTRLAAFQEKGDGSALQAAIR